jgi:alpha-glucoside transport system substrate-binding protein
MRRKVTALLLAGLLVVAMAACAPSEPGNGTDEPDEDIGSVSVMGVWGGGELEAFNTVAAGWQDSTGGTVDFESTRDLTAILRARVAGGNPPDLAILPNPALLQEFASAGNLVALDGAVDTSMIEADYSDAWLDLGSVDGDLYGVFVKAATKSTVWYNPATFNSNSYETPTTWDELIALSDQMVADGATPWSIGIEAGGATGWAGTDWIQEIFLAEQGPDKYDQWVNHEIPWTDPAVKASFERFGEIALADGYVVGGVNNILATGPEDASYLPFEATPRANMYFLGSFTQGFIEAQFTDLTATEDYDFFKFVEIEPMYTGSATGGADVLVMFNDTPSSRALFEYLSDGSNWESWAAAGGYASPSQALDVGVYPDDLAAKAATQLTDSAIFRFDADDLMPGEVQSKYFSSVGEYLQNPGNLDTILADIEAVAATAYSSQ